MCFGHLIQPPSGSLTHKRVVCFKGRDLPLRNNEYTILVTWISFQVVNNNNCEITVKIN